jgi:hypothetical protein
MGNERPKGPKEHGKSRAVSLSFPSADGCFQICPQTVGRLPSISYD